MNKKAAVAFVCIYLFLYFLNYLHPMSFGDDYLYSFIWQGKPMNVPLEENAVRVASWHDIIISQWSHYFTWGGRTVAHVLAQFFLWTGKEVFNFFNAFIAIVLVAEIYWCINKGKVTLDFDARTVCWVFFVLWAFTPGFSPVFFWLTAACNYLWTNVILLAFLIPYVHRYYFFSVKNGNSYSYSFFMFVFGIIAGWTNENSVCWVILTLLVFLFKNFKKSETEKWLFAGLVGLMAGYSLLIFSPGNAARLLAEQSDGSNWLNLVAFKANFNMFLSIIFFQTFLWFFNLRALFSLKRKDIQNTVLIKEIILVKTLCMLAFCMTAIMFFSPGFPPRSGFSGTIHLIIAAGVLLRVQEEYDIELIQHKAKKFLFYVGSFYFAMTATITACHFYKTHLYFGNLLSYVKQEKMASADKILTVEYFKESTHKEDVLSGFHIPRFELSDNENYWVNVAFARYYGIKGVRMIKENTDSDSVQKETVKTEAIPAGSQSR